MDFDKAFELVVGLEGGYVNDPVDPGGETKYGISKRAYPNENIKELTLERAKVLYHRDYWLAVEPDKITTVLLLPMFDTAVNMGVKVSKILLQRSLNLNEDGIIGPITMRAIKQSKKDELIANYMAERAIRYTKTVNFDRYQRGWMRRLFHVTIHNET